ncbi:hypothetical protein EDD86DRAFT_182380, partial [Gorgonomyces haynaldii]
IAKEAVSSLFTNKISYQENCLDAHYATDCTFDDPLVSVKGIRNIKAQFRFVAWFPQVSSRILSVSTATTTLAGSHELLKIVTVESVVTFGLIPGWIELPLRTYSKMLFNQENKIIQQEDIWSIKHTIEIVLGSLYQKLRSFNGDVSSVAIEKI